MFKMKEHMQDLRSLLEKLPSPKTLDVVTCFPWVDPLRALELRSSMAAVGLLLKGVGHEMTSTQAHRIVYYKDKKTVLFNEPATLQTQKTRSVVIGQLLMDGHGPNSNVTELRDVLQRWRPRVMCLEIKSNTDVEHVKEWLNGLALGKLIELRMLRWDNYGVPVCGTSFMAVIVAEKHKFWDVSILSQFLQDMKAKPDPKMLRDCHLKSSSKIVKAHQLFWSRRTVARKSNATQDDGVDQGDQDKVEDQDKKNDKAGDKEDQDQEQPPRDNKKRRLSEALAKFESNPKGKDMWFMDVSRKANNMRQNQVPPSKTTSVILASKGKKPREWTSHEQLLARGYQDFEVGLQLLNSSAVGAAVMCVTPVPIATCLLGAAMVCSQSSAQ